MDEQPKPLPNQEFLINFEDSGDQTWSHIRSATADSVKDYLRRISKEPSLSEAEEFELGQQIAEGRRASETLESGVAVAPDAQRRLRQAVKLGVHAKQVLIDANLKLVVAVAKSQVGKGLPFLDLVQEGNFGLTYAVEKFDHTRGYRFSAYSIWWVRQAMARALANQGRDVRIPVHMQETFRKVAKAEEKLRKKLDREPTIEELSAECGLTVEAISKLDSYERTVISLDLPLDSTGDVLLEDTLVDEGESVEAMTENMMLIEQLNAILDTFSGREAMVVKERFGLVDGRQKTLEEIGDIFGVTRERIRQIESKAMSKLRHPSLRELLHDFLRD